MSTTDEDVSAVGLGGLETDICAGNTSSSKSIVGTPFGLEDAKAAPSRFEKAQLLSSDLLQVMPLPSFSSGMPLTVPLPASVCSTACDAVPANFMPQSLPLPSERMLPSFSKFDAADFVKNTKVAALP
eukprot:CAMPEP_0172696166 /NCGR_PEP_ID=MMETSP1074-20121228/27863_1 /TAXON_ID=2916 /ORGANISM="Ceratium fusus, Strain PA161109" /LENGTH=127 /DNA_ID=CAMNT_0013516871 /DNA_START=1 /DNA_END=380 /DNA_ORIENTATION=-